jgi:PleD family two-component response regulator
LSEARPVIVGIWKNLHPGVKPYILLLSKGITTADAILAGANDQLTKPLDQQELDDKIVSAQRLQSVMRWLAHEDNVHSAAGMIGKAAFYQLFLSAMDRAFRYGERSMIIFISLENHVEMRAAVDPAVFTAHLTELCRQMTFMRRQSDVLARLSEHDFAVLLQRPQHEAEAINTIDRFSEFLAGVHKNFQGNCPAPRLKLTLLEMPQGHEHAERHVPPRQEQVVHV